MRVTVENVAWSVRDVTIIEKIDGLFEQGTFTGLLGPNGSGKTTLLNVIAGLRKPTAGIVRADADSIHALAGRVRARRIALVEQHAHTGLELRVREVVELGRVPHQGMFGGSQHESIADAMKLARIEHLGDRSWQTLSGGERQRTQLARALAQQPSLLLLDEPTNHLDLGHQLDFLDTVRGLGVTTVAALHDLELAAAYCDRLVVLKGGRIVAAGAVGEVLTADLLDEVYGVRATVTPHPSTGRPHLTWHGTTGALHD